MSLLSSLRVGHSGLSAASAGVDVTSHNVSNAATPGFSRRRVEQAIADPLRRGPQWIGAGVRIDGIGRAADGLIARRATLAAGTSKNLETAYGALQPIESLFESEAGRGLRGVVDAFFNALSAATTDPADRSRRSAVLKSATDLADTVQSTAKSLETAQDEQMEAAVADMNGVNEDLTEIAALNARMIAAGGPLTAGDLADRRDLAIRRLAESIGATVHFEGDGTATVMLGGHAVVSGAEARQVTADATGATPRVLVSSDSGWLDATSEAGGEVRGRLDAWTEMEGWLTDLDAFATDFSAALNTQHSAGFDRTGAAGGNVFDIGGTGRASVNLRLDAAMVDAPDALAFAGAATSAAGDGVNLAALIGLHDDPIIGGTRSAGTYMTELVGDVGAVVAGLQYSAEGAAAVLEDADALHASLTSVDLDEEATNLLMFQAAYQAAAKVIQTTDQMLQTLMEIG